MTEKVLPELVDIIVYSNVSEKQTPNFESVISPLVVVLDTKNESMSRCAAGFVSTPKAPGGPNICPGKYNLLQLELQKARLHIISGSLAISYQTITPLPCKI